MNKNTTHSPFLEIIQGKTAKRPAVWFMRQAGRCLPEYQALKKKHSFFQLMSDPELASDITLMPVKKLQVDAAIVFSDILILIEALGIIVDYENGKPTIKNPIGAHTGAGKKIGALPKLPKKKNLEVFSRTYNTLAHVKKKSDIPLIGFCGGPLTIFFYLFEGRGENFHLAKQFLYSHPLQAKKILKEITDLSIIYARGQIQEKIDAFQIFESWAGTIPHTLYKEMVLPEVKRLCKSLEKYVPTIFYPRGYGEGYWHLPKGREKICQVVGIDQFTSLETMAKKLGKQQILQGNIDPYVPLAMRDDVLKKSIKEYLKFFRQHPKWIINLGHGVLPDTNWKKLKIIVDTIRHFK